MAHIVYITNGMASTLNSSLELSRQLLEAGHQVTFVSHADLGDDVRGLGVRFHRLARDRELDARADADPPPWKGTLVPPLGRILRWIRRRRRIRSDSLTQTELEELLDRLHPDALLVDIEMHVATITSLAVGVPVVLVMVWFSIFRDPSLPPMHTSLMPGTGLAERLAIRIAWARTRMERVTREWRRRVHPKFLNIHLRPVLYSTVRIEDLSAVARAKGISLRRETDRSHWLRPCLYPKLPLLSFNLWEMEFPHVKRPNLHYVGPMVAVDRTDRQVGGASWGAWSEFRARRSSHGGAPRRRLVYCSLGTFWSSDQAFLSRIVAVFRDRGDWDLVLGLGGKLRPEDLGPVPDHVVCLEWAPQLEVLREADCAITHGGITTINECIAFGVPMVVYSTGHVDQNGCAARVGYHGLGVVGDKDRDPPDVVERRIERALRDRSIRENVDTMRERLIAHREAGTAVKVIERILATGPREQA